MLRRLKLARMAWDKDGEIDLKKALVVVRHHGLALVRHKARIARIGKLKAAPIKASKPRYAPGVLASAFNWMKSFFGSKS